MATFTAPTHNEYFAPPGVDRLWSRVPYARAEAVLVEDGVASLHQVVDGDRLVNADTWYGNGATYDVGADEEVALVSLFEPLDLDVLTQTWPAWLA